MIAKRKMFYFCGTIAEQTRTVHQSTEDGPPLCWKVGRDWKNPDTGGSGSSWGERRRHMASAQTRPGLPCSPRRDSETPGTMEAAERGLKIKHRHKQSLPLHSDPLCPDAHQPVKSKVTNKHQTSHVFCN